MSVDPTADRPVYQQVADILRDRIRTGELAPGQLLPSEPHMVDEFGVARSTARQALAVLRGEGLVVTVPRRGTVVRPRADAEIVTLVPGQEAEARMPSPDERRRLKIPEGVPVFVVKRPGQEPEVYPADRTRLRAADEQ
ncbi:regulatory protein, gntR family [Thermomonospora echinospora]|uniref:Regulatory protein, gntR family n=1 Tax=Thermomonospora echinospora TaxID=1992 RepID=A0A1H6CUZ3_9ACTN|nr:GntR family transcriptional regulator [Thermomonospora echinospora]SEG76792.1 regulatory protein, gntR family [Thermomonospora echinospora]